MQQVYKIWIINTIEYFKYIQSIDLEERNPSVIEQIKVYIEYTLFMITKLTYLSEQLDIAMSKDHFLSESMHRKTILKLLNVAQKKFKNYNQLQMQILFTLCAS